MPRTCCSWTKQNDDGTPDYHGWPDRFGFLPSSQAVFNPICGPADDLPCAQVMAEDVPIRDVLNFPSQHDGFLPTKVLTDEVHCGISPVIDGSRSLRHEALVCS